MNHFSLNTRLHKLKSRILLSLLAGCAFQVSAQTIPRDTTYNPQSAWRKVVKKYPTAQLVVPQKNAGVRKIYNQVYATIDSINYGKRALHLDVFSPQKPGIYPAVIMIHGGGWRSGDRSMEYPMAQFMAAHGYVAVTVEYRLALEALYPNAVYDIKAAIRYVKKHAADWGIDTARIAIEGNSAGGQLATLVGMTSGIPLFEGKLGDTTCSSRIQAVVDIDGLVDFLAPNSLNQPKYPDWLGGPFALKAETWKEASPIFWVNKTSPPILFVTSTVPRFTAGMAEMMDLYEQFGLDAEKHKIPDTPHTFWLFEPWFTPTVGYMKAFLDRVFHYSK